VETMILGLDPGGTTGWCLATFKEDGSVRWNYNQLGPEPHHDELFSLLEAFDAPNFHVVCESFEFRQGKQRQGIVLDSCEYIGVVKLFAQQRPGTPVVFQTAGAAKGFVSNDKLRAMELWKGVAWKHAMDATRHVVTYAVTRLKRYDLIESWKGLA
jgi:hypothetical protein